MSIRVATLLLCVLALASPSFANNKARLFNAGFDRCQIEGKPCEWLLEGKATVATGTGIVTLSDIPFATETQLYQTVYLCTPGVRYNAVLTISEIISPGTLVRLGLDPTGGQDPLQTAWAETQLPETLAVECEAAGNNVRVVIAVSNSARAAAASFDGVEFTTHSSVQSLGPQPQMADAMVRAQAKADIDTAIDLLDKCIQRPDADRLLSDIVANHPDARPEAARALVELQRVRHGYQWEIYDMPREEWEDFLGLPFLRQALEQYPDQAEACALARFRMAQHYLGFQLIPQAFELLDSVIEDYPETEGHWWAKTFMINALLWSGNPHTASDVLKEIQAAQETGAATIAQKAWAEYLFHTQTLHHNWSVDAREARFAYNDKTWTEYVDSYREIAIRAKLFNANEFERLKHYQRAIDACRDMLKVLDVNSPHMGPPRMILSRILITRGWLPEHRAEGFALLEEVAGAVLASTRMHIAARRDIETYTESPDGYGTIDWAPPIRGRNLLINGEFERPPLSSQDPKIYAYDYWRFDVKPNWAYCNWQEGAPEPGLGELTPAWSSINGGLLRGNLIHDPMVVDSSAPYRAAVWVAADALGEGKIEDVRYKLSLRFTDGFNNSLGEHAADTIWCNLGPRTWQEVVLEGITPENACFAEFVLYLDVTGEGQHNTAMTGATLILGENK